MVWKHKHPMTVYLVFCFVFTATVKLKEHGLEYTPFPVLESNTITNRHNKTTRMKKKQKNPNDL